MALCVYKRIRPDPIRLNINGELVIVKGGQMIVAENSQMMGVSGFAFIKIYEQKDNFVPANSNLVITRPRPLIDSFEPMVVEVHQVNQEQTRPVHTPSFIDEPVIVEVTKEELQQPQVIGFNKETIAKLKSFDNKQWFALKKDDIIKFLEDAKIEYKHISGDKWELLKFLKKVIKDL
jgi:hypothetical protein